MQCRIWFNKKAKNDKWWALGPCVTNTNTHRSIWEPLHHIRINDMQRQEGANYNQCRLITFNEEEFSEQLWTRKRSTVWNQWTEAWNILWSWHSYAEWTKQSTQR